MKKGKRKIRAQAKLHLGRIRVPIYLWTWGYAGSPTTPGTWTLFIRMSRELTCDIMHMVVNRYVTNYHVKSVRRRDHTYRKAF